jgi:hypothetical protein
MAWRSPLQLPLTENLFEVEECVEFPKIIHGALLAEGEEPVDTETPKGIAEAILDIGVHKILNACTACAKARLADALRQGGWAVPADANAALSLATSLFLCITPGLGCVYGPMSPLDALAHRCPCLRNGAGESTSARLTKHWYDPDHAQ